MNDSAVITDNASSAVGRLSFEMFCSELRHVARFITAAAPANPLEAVLTAIRGNPALSQARLLTRMLAAYAGRQVSFRSAEVAAFDREHLGLVVALMNTHNAGTLSESEWLRAADAADAAQRDIGG